MLGLKLQSKPSKVLVGVRRGSSRPQHQRLLRAALDLILAHALERLDVGPLALDLLLVARFPDGPHAGWPPLL